MSKPADDAPSFWQGIQDVKVGSVFIQVEYLDHDLWLNARDRAASQTHSGSPRLAGGSVMEQQLESPLDDLKRKLLEQVRDDKQDERQHQRGQEAHRQHVKPQAVKHLHKPSLWWR